MDTVVKCCAILHNTIIGHRDLDGTTVTKNIVSVDSNAILVPVRHNLCFSIEYG